MKCLRIKDQINTHGRTERSIMVPWRSGLPVAGRETTLWPAQSLVTVSVTHDVLSVAGLHCLLLSFINTVVSSLWSIHASVLHASSSSTSPSSPHLQLQPHLFTSLSISEESSSTNTSVGTQSWAPCRVWTPESISSFYTHFLYFILSSLLIKIFHWLSTDSVVNLAY